MDAQETFTTEEWNAIPDPHTEFETADQKEINHPKHYTAGKVECIDAIESAVADLNGFEAYCVGNAIKYLWRWRQKGGKKDIGKAQWYLNRLIDALNKAENPVG